ncbi:MAG: hypothetical protein M3O50_02480 [Myxococcota bacterium]|nr:hypothetical protein [Myxococcota bacterium]
MGLRFLSIRKGDRPRHGRKPFTGVKERLAWGEGARGMGFRRASSLDAGSANVDNVASMTNHFTPPPAR